MVHDSALLGLEDTAARLMGESTKASENGELYALVTAQNAAASSRAQAAKPRLTAACAILTLKAMEVQFTPDQRAFVRQAIESGRLRREEDAVKEALSLWEERERTRAEILAAVDEAEASVARGEGRIITQESMRALAEDMKRRGRARLAAEQQTPR